MVEERKPTGHRSKEVTREATERAHQEQLCHVLRRGEVKDQSKDVNFIFPVRPLDFSPLPSTIHDSARYSREIPARFCKWSSSVGVRKLERECKSRGRGREERRNSAIHSPSHLERDCWKSFNKIHRTPVTVQSSRISKSVSSPTLTLSLSLSCSPISMAVEKDRISKQKCCISAPCKQGREGGREGEIKRGGC